MNLITLAWIAVGGALGSTMRFALSTAVLRMSGSLFPFGTFVVNLVGCVAFGAIVGAIAKLLMPGRDPGGFVVTILLGVAGALVGGFVGRALGWYEANQGAGFLMSLVGAVLLLWVYRMATRQQRT